MAALLAVYAATTTAQRGPAKATDIAAKGLTIERIGAEPDTAIDVVHISDPLRWSADGRRVAWMRLSVTAPKTIGPPPQQEIWGYAPEAENSNSQAQTLPQSAKPVLLLSAAKVTSALSGTDAPVHKSLDNEDAGSNPFLLRDFAWSPRGDEVLLIGGNSLATVDLTSAISRVLVSGDEPLTDAALSPDGRTVSFIRKHSLCLVSMTGGAVHTFAASPQRDVLEGELDWPYRNALHLVRGYAWSPDSSTIAYLEIDDRAVDRYAIRASDGSTRELVFPKAGGELPIVRVLVKAVAIRGGVAREARIGSTKGLYVPRFQWLPDSRHLAIERLDRRQQNLDLLVSDVATGSSRVVLTEKDAYWINLADDLYFLKDSRRFVWSSERTGFRHLYLYNIEGHQLTQLTKGDWEVTRLHAVDEQAGLAYFTATEKSPLERHLYQVGLDGSDMKRITQSPGTHLVSVAPMAASYMDTYSTQAKPPHRQWLSFAHSKTDRIETEHVANGPKLGQSDQIPPLQPVEFIHLKLHLGAEANAFFIKPPGFDPAKKYPVIMYLAGGPGEQLVRDAWGGATGLWMQSMVQKGFIVFALDNQATAGRGHAFEEPIHLRLGGQEMADQRDGVIFLSTLPFVDSTRLGVCGWGYGGFLAVHGILDRPVPFKAAFAGAPVIDWHFYDAFFAERYLDDPVAHADGWDASTALENRSPTFFKGALLVAQGTDDEYVHLENLMTLQDRLLDVGKSADILLLSGRGHHIEDAAARTILFARMTDFFIKNL
jgi:dipeptidyl-peptidase-4